jgi:Leucine-rich repeat (LRR) protein
MNLRKLYLMDNNIIKIQGLESCTLLEELSLEKNKIKVIENIGHLKYLKKLDLG